MNRIYKFWMDTRYQLGLINEQGDSIRRLKRLHKLCVEIKCGNKMNHGMEAFQQCYQPERCFNCEHYQKATKTKPNDYGWRPLR